MQENGQLDEFAHAVVAYFEPFIEKRSLGMKSGRGFYTYPAPAYQQADFLSSEEPDPEVYHAIAAALIGRAALIAHAGIADPEEIDRTWMIGTAQSIGPFGMLEKMGVDNFLARTRKSSERLTLLSEEEQKIVEAFISQL
jgi:3-hydroxyacyl-CoA dehydrogenase